MKDRVFHTVFDGSPPSGPSSWFAVPTDDPAALVAHMRAANIADLRDHFVRGDFERWLRDLYHRPDLAEGVRRLREDWNGGYVPRNEIIALLEAKLNTAS
jgi:hypothetical protein